MIDNKNNDYNGGGSEVRDRGMSVNISRTRLIPSINTSNTKKKRRIRVCVPIRLGISTVEGVHALRDQLMR